MAGERVQRKLAAILAADVVGYSRLMGSDEAGTLAKFNDHLNGLIRPAIASRRGRIVKTVGDGLLVEFASVVDAVECAVDIQRGMLERNADEPDDRRIRFRIGVNLGDVIVEHDDIHGDGVNVAARLEALADPGGVCISRAARDQIRDRLPFGLEDWGEVEVKNIARPVRVFRVLPDVEDAGKSVGKSTKTAGKYRLAIAAAVMALVAGGGTVYWIQPWKSEAFRVGSSLSAKSSIAVLPFSNLSKDPNQEYFSDGITNDLITDLSKFHDLFVIASNSVFRYKGGRARSQEVGRDLGVRYVLEGSVQKLNERVRINAQLIRASTGQHLWAERYDEDFKNLFDLQDRITKQIVGTLAVKLNKFERDRASAKPTRDLEAYDYYLRGRELYARLRRTENYQARQMFRKAVALDPGFASALASIGWTYFAPVLYGWTGSPQSALNNAHHWGRKALEIDENNVEGYSVLASVYVLRRQYDLAIAQAQQAVALNPNNAVSRARFGEVLVWSGRTDDAIVSLETAQRFDPLTTAANLTHLGMAYYLKGRFKDARKVLERCVNRDPDFVFGQTVLAATYARLGLPEEAARAASSVRRLDPFFSTDKFGILLRNSSDKEAIAAGLRMAGLN